MEVDWRLPSERPFRHGTAIVQNLDGLYFWVTIDDDFDTWSDEIIRWAYVNF